MRVRYTDSLKGYILEFILLFSAVTLGFIAENLRQDFAEQQDQRDFMRSLLFDLQGDVSNISKGMPLKAERLRSIDSIFKFFRDNPNVDKIPSSVVKHMKHASWDRSFERNTATITQLKNAGGLNLIDKTNISDSIAWLDFRWSRMDYFREMYRENQHDIYTLEEKILNAFDMIDYYYKNNTVDNADNVPPNRMIKINREYISQYLNLLARQQTVTRQDRSNYLSVMQTSEHLIVLIKKEYGF